MSENSSEKPLGAVSMGSVPMGTVVAFALNEANIPEGWLPCDGSEIPAQYPELISALGSNYTPDLAGCTLIGTGAGTDSRGTARNWTLGNTGGEYDNVLTEEQMPSHQHFGWGVDGTPNWGGETSSSSNQVYTGANGHDSNNRLAGSTYSGGVIDENYQVSTQNGSATGTMPGATSPHNNMQPYYAMNYIIYTGVNG